ncbi:MAG: site-specific DNA-methyltransferase [Nitrospirae bacterium]|nr:site-specific DNA-methyltransferase [Nitrospirota bacterium]
MQEIFQNKIFNEDVMSVLKRMPDNYVDMIYSDPDYNVGIKYNDKSYTKDFKEYIDWYIELAKESLRVLKDEGNLFFINYPKQNAYLQVKFLEDVCYEVSEYVWIYNTNVGHSPKKFTRAHRSILHCRKIENNKWFKKNVAEPYKNPTDKRILGNIANGSTGRMPYSWLYYNLVKNVSRDKTIHSCQIPLGLVEKLILASTEENDLVFIHFGGSGSEIILTKHLKRKFVSAEIDKIYHDMILERLKRNGDIPHKYKLQIERKQSDRIINNQMVFFDAKAQKQDNL